MDARLVPSQILGLKAGDAHVIRNAGGIVTEDALRSLIISHELLGTQEFIIINHTDCGMLTFTKTRICARSFRNRRERLPWRRWPSTLSVIFKRMSASRSRMYNRIPGLP